MTHAGMSPYNIFDGNPVYHTDPSGACTDCGGDDGSGGGEGGNTEGSSGKVGFIGEEVVIGTIEVVAEKIQNLKITTIDTRNIRISNNTSSDESTNEPLVFTYGAGKRTKESAMANDSDRKWTTGDGPVMGNLRTGATPIPYPNKRVERMNLYPTEKLESRMRNPLEHV